MAKDKKPAKGFRIGKDVRSVVVTRYERISDSRDHPEKKKIAVIRKAETVARLVSLVNSLPAAGTAMIKMGDVDFIHADFHGHYDKPPVAVKLYNGWVQAPDTSFYEGLPQEKEIHEILSSAKPQPKSGLRVSKVASIRVEEFDHGTYDVSQQDPNRSVVIQDKKTVNDLAGWVNQLPLKGGMFVSFTPMVSETKLFFVDENGDETLVQFYNSGISATDGSFYTEGPGQDLEKRIWAVLQAELARTAPEKRYAFDADFAQSVSIELRPQLNGRATAWELVTDLKVIKQIQTHLSKLPKDGDVMKSWSDDTELLSAVFSRPGAPKTYIEFYDGRLKTPTTGFYAAGKNPEAPLYKLLKEQLKEGK